MLPKIKYGLSDNRKLYNYKKKMTVVINNHTTKDNGNGSYLLDLIAKWKDLIKCVG